jgi:TRAP-type C4-dicarboxylate transport system permease large subunit
LVAIGGRPAGAAEFTYKYANNLPVTHPPNVRDGAVELFNLSGLILAMGIGLFAPPLGVGYYAACAIGRVSPDVGMRRIWPYLGALLIGLLAVAAIPWISTGFL